MGGIEQERQPARPRNVRECVDLAWSPHR
jgi:hypothetical protein